MLITATVHKDGSTKLGIAAKVSSEGHVVISAIQSDSLFSTTDLQVGHVIISINTQPCTGLSAKEAMVLLRDAEGTITVLVEDGSVAPTLQATLLYATRPPAPATQPARAPQPAIKASVNHPPRTDPGGVW